MAFQNTRICTLTEQTTTLPCMCMHARTHAHTHSTPALALAPTSPEVSPFSPASCCWSCCSPTVALLRCPGFAGTLNRMAKVPRSQHSSPAKRKGMGQGRGDRGGWGGPQRVGREIKRPKSVCIINKNLLPSPHLPSPSSPSALLPPPDRVPASHPLL